MNQADKLINLIMPSQSLALARLLVQL